MVLYHQLKEGAVPWGHEACQAIKALPPPSHLLVQTWLYFHVPRTPPCSSTPQCSMTDVLLPHIPQVFFTNPSFCPNKMIFSASASRQCPRGSCSCKSSEKASAVTGKHFCGGLSPLHVWNPYSLTQETLQEKGPLIGFISYYSNRGWVIWE